VGGKKISEKNWGRWWLALIPDVNSQLLKSLESFTDTEIHQLHKGTSMKRMGN
jgi:hypothetical protein